MDFITSKERLDRATWSIIGVKYPSSLEEARDLVFKIVKEICSGLTTEDYLEFYKEAYKNEILHEERRGY